MGSVLGLGKYQAYFSLSPFGDWTFPVFIVLTILFGGTLVFASGIGLLLISLKDDEMGALGFIALIGYITALSVIPLYALFVSSS